MLQFLLPLSLAHGLRECVYGELDHPLSTVISGPWTAVSGGSVRQKVDIMGECELSSLVSTECCLFVNWWTHFLGSLQMHGNDHGGRKLKRGWDMTTNPKNNEKMAELEISRSGQV